jgi:hypothetical protein
MPLDDKNRLKLDKVFMAFGSIMKAADRGLADEGKLKAYADAAWMWSIRNVYQVVDELYAMSEKAGPESPPPPAKQELRGETETITVKGMTLQNSGVTKQGRQWKLYKITDEHGHNYFTFHTNFQIGETYEVDWQWKEEGEKRWRTIPNTPRPVHAVTDRNPQYATQAEYDDSDIPF